LQVRIFGGKRFRRPLRGQGRPEEEGHLREAASRTAGSCSATHRDTFSRETLDLATAPASSIDEGGLTFSAHVDRTGSGRRSSTSPPSAPTWGEDVGPLRSAARSGPRHGPRPRQVARARPPAGVRLGSPESSRTSAASSTWPPCAFSDPNDDRAVPACCRPAVVHDHVRPRQHLHEPPGAALHAGARRRPRSWRSASWQGTRVDDFRDEDPGRICTRCATAR
jgi:hypothetical protein